MTFDPMRGPAALATGAVGELRIGGLLAGTLTEWRIVISPTTGQPTLIGAGRFARYFAQGAGSPADATVTPHAPHAYIGRPRPPPPAPLTITGTLVELTATSVTIASGTITHTARG